jgi:hypothetical protein
MIVREEKGIGNDYPEFLSDFTDTLIKMQIEQSSKEIRA